MRFEFEKSRSWDWRHFIKAFQDIDGKDLPGFQEALLKISGALESDLEALRRDAAFIFSTDGDAADMPEHSIDLLASWYRQGNAPSLAAMCIFAVEALGLETPRDLAQGMLMAGVLGEVESDLAYHNNMHYRKVLLQALCLIQVHNQIYHGTLNELKAEDVLQVLIAVCIHDFGHDGKGNTVQGVFQQSRLERRSFELAQPFLRRAELNNEQILGAVRVMLLCTDVTPLGEPTTPCAQMKAAYRYHFLGDKNKIHALNLDDSLKRLEKEPLLVLMCLLMHEADIATSAGLDYEMTKFETSLLRREFLDETAQPQHVIDFLNLVCQRQMLSNAAQDLYGANMARIYALAEKDVKDGNQSFPEPEYSAFALGHAEDSGAPKSIN